MGITSTMVIDPASGTLFASAEVLSGSSVTHMVVRPSTSPRIGCCGAATSTGPGGRRGAQLQRIGLALSAGHVVVGFGGNFGDCGTYHGWVVGVPESGTGALLAYRVPTAARAPFGRRRGPR